MRPVKAQIAVWALNQSHHELPRGPFPKVSGSIK